MSDPIIRWEEKSITLAMPSLGSHLKKKIEHYGSMVRNVELNCNKVTYEVQRKYMGSIANELGAFVNGYVLGRQEK